MAGTRVTNEDDDDESRKLWVACACLVAASSPALAQKEGAVIIDGNDWISASAVERPAFRVGAGNTIVAENGVTARGSRQ